jgi:hypothetical protein
MWKEGKRVKLRYRLFVDGGQYGRGFGGGWFGVGIRIPERFDQLGDAVGIGDGLGGGAVGIAGDTDFRPEDGNVFRGGYPELDLGRGGLEDLDLDVFADDDGFAAAPANDEH